MNRELIDNSKIAAKIAEVELKTSAEIRVCIAKKPADKNPVEAAKKVFNKYKLYKTKNRNAVLIYLCLSSKQAAIIGDSGINSKVPENFWQNVFDIMRQNFSANNFDNGLIEAIELSALKLAEFFPYVAGDINEVSNDVIEQ